MLPFVHILLGMGTAPMARNGTYDLVYTNWCNLVYEIVCKIVVRAETNCGRMLMAVRLCSFN